MDYVGWASQTQGWPRQMHGCARYRDTWIITEPTLATAANELAGVLNLPSRPEETSSSFRFLERGQHRTCRSTRAFLGCRAHRRSKLYSRAHSFASRIAEGDLWQLNDDLDQARRHRPIPTRQRGFGHLKFVGRISAVYVTLAGFRSSHLPSFWAPMEVAKQVS